MGWDILVGCFLMEFSGEQRKGKCETYGTYLRECCTRLDASHSLSCPTDEAVMGGNYFENATEWNQLTRD